MKVGASAKTTVSICVTVMAGPLTGERSLKRGTKWKVVECLGRPFCKLTTPPPPPGRCLCGRLPANDPITLHSSPDELGSGVCVSFG